MMMEFQPKKGQLKDNPTHKVKMGLILLEIQQKGTTAEPASVQIVVV